ncbi:uncharacterized protein LOC135122025 isoform X1 [Zophobas morio]|uniref:uncharacterized protein LOC135122025 isoform X1 n=2 Tax=Zophobas morio TaxID=2755281 RepID=UPI0030831348
MNTLRMSEEEEVKDLLNEVKDDLEADDPELEAMKRRVNEMMSEHKKLQELQAQLEKQLNHGSPGDKEARDLRSVYVGNVDYSTTPEELQQHFRSAGSINKITIMRDSYTGHPKGFAYIEFSDPEMVPNALVMDDSPFKGRVLKVLPKRTNIPGLKLRGRYRGRARPYRPYYYRPRPRFRNLSL